MMRNKAPIIFIIFQVTMWRRERSKKRDDNFLIPDHVVRATCRDILILSLITHKVLKYRISLLCTMVTVFDFKCKRITVKEDFMKQIFYLKTHFQRLIFCCFRRINRWMSARLMIYYIISFAVLFLHIPLLNNLFMIKQ